MLKFISLLGTGKYVPCNYYLDNQKAYNCCYVQEAIFKILQQKDMPPDEVIIFTTEQSHEVNWINCAYNDESKEKGKRESLYNTLKDIVKEDGKKIKNVMIPFGNTEQDLWILFERVLNEIDENDEIILDITHSFRYLPMLVFIVINYARYVKKCSLRYIYYGAFETLGSTKQVDSMPMEKRNAPIFDLTPFADLFDWTIGIDRYLATGDASIVSQLTDSEIKKINLNIKKTLLTSEHSEPRTLFKNPNQLRELSDSMKAFSDAVFTCRGQELSKTVGHLKNSIDLVMESTAHQDIKPLTPVIGKLKKQFEKFISDTGHLDDSYLNDYINSIETAKWCLNNKMYQQGLTILHEGLISYVCDKWGIDKINETNRKKVTSYSRMVFERYKGKDKYKKDIDNYEDKDNYKCQYMDDAIDYMSLDIDSSAVEEQFLLIYNIGDLRNDINHAGWKKNTARPSKFSDGLGSFIKRTKNIIYLQNKQLLLIFSHQLTSRQIEEAQQKFGISKFVPLKNELMSMWSNIPPDLEHLQDYLLDILKWIDINGRSGDYALVQGDHGATMLVVNYCKSKNIIPVYATTKRVVKEEVSGEKVMVSREFEHVIFRKYEIDDKI
jgi:CRISPR-associated Csx2 family protein